MQSESESFLKADLNIFHVVNAAGVEIPLKSREICIIWFIMTGMKPKDLSLLLNMSEQSLSYHKRKIMRKLQVESNFEFFSWFRRNRRVFNSEEAETCILKPSEF